VNMLLISRELSYTIDEALDLPFKAIPVIMRGIDRLKNRDRVEALRIAIGSQATKKYTQDLMKFYVDGSRSPAEMEKKRQKAVSTDVAFGALKQLLRH